MIEPISAIRVNQISNPNKVLYAGVFGENENRDFIPEYEGEIDSFVNSSSDVTAKKYNLACQVAAYYKTQYENLLKDGCCIA